jgi:hypothetical protein
MIQSYNNPIETQAKILIAAKLFAKQGHEAVTNRVKAEKVSMKEITIFRNLNTKKQLFKSVVDDYTNLQTIQDTAQSPSSIRGTGCLPDRPPGGSRTAQEGRSVQEGHALFIRADAGKEQSKHGASAGVIGTLTGI